MSRQHDVEQLAMVVAELVDEFRTAELHEWRPTRDCPEFADRSKPLPKIPERRVHRTREPGMLEQLRRGTGRRRAVAKASPGDLVDAWSLTADMAPTPGRPENTGGGHSKPGSRPPGSLHAAETLAELTVAIGETRARVAEGGGQPVPRAAPVAVMLRDLLDLALRQDNAGEWLVDAIWVRVLLGKARGWASSARVALSYDAPVVELRVYCPVCRGRMLVRSDATSDVWCGGIRGRVKEGPVRRDEAWPMLDRGCGATWPRISWLDLLDDQDAEDDGEQAAG